MLPRGGARRHFSARSGLKETGLDRLIRAGYALLHLVTYLHRRSEGGARLDDHAAAPRRRRPPA